MAVSPYTFGHPAAAAGSTKTSCGAVVLYRLPFALHPCLHLTSVVVHKTSGVAACQDQTGRGQPHKNHWDMQSECSFGPPFWTNAFSSLQIQRYHSWLQQYPEIACGAVVEQRKVPLTPRILSGCVCWGELSPWYKMTSW